MPIIQISKMQLRRGPASDLPTPSLDDGELGFTTDTGRLFVGQLSPTLGQQNFARVAFPYQNVEVFTENSPTIQMLFGDNQHSFISALPLIATNSPLTMQTSDSSHTPQDFHLELGVGVNATIQYFMFDVSNNPLRVGRINVLWYPGMVGPPKCTDDSDSLDTGPTDNLHPADFAWTAALVSGPHVVLQYVNQTGGPVLLLFRIDRPSFT
jgi:hypothetical protein